MNDKLPEIKKRKKIDIKKFENLAEKVKKIFAEENEYLKNKDNGNNTTSGFLTNS